MRRFASVVAALIAALQLGVIPTSSEAEAYKAPRTADGKPKYPAPPWGQR